MNLSYQYVGFALAAFAGLRVSGYSQQNEWTWMGGSQLADRPGIYGLMGVPARGNIPGGRLGATRWVDRDGNVWVFGGGGYDSTEYGSGVLNDLWKFNPSTNEWTWMSGSSLNTSDGFGQGHTGGMPPVYGTQGVFSPENVPSGRAAAAGWVDKDGHLWLFGGSGLDLRPPPKEGDQFCYVDEMWEYDPATNEWAWITGSNFGTTVGDSSGTNLGEACGQPAVYGTLGVPSPDVRPGNLEDVLTWTDRDGNFWMYGGWGKDKLGEDGFLNDLWMFNPTKKQWTWMGGVEKLPPSGGIDGDVSVIAVYGNRGVFSPENNPGSRGGSATWTDRDGNLWLFSGGGCDDMWKYDLSLHQWAWMSGPSKFTTCDQGGVGNLACPWPGVYGALGVPSPSNRPGTRAGSVTWRDKKGNVWIFGGGGNGVTASETGDLNDIWMYNPTTTEWAWMGGPKGVPGCEMQHGVTLCTGYGGLYAPLGEVSATGEPGGRIGAVGWTDLNGRFWVFAGAGYDTTNNNGDLNDLWMFQPSTIVLPPATAPLFNPAPGLYSHGGLLRISNGVAEAKYYFTTDGTTPTAGSTLYRGPFEVSKSETVKAIAVVPGYRPSGVSAATYFFSSLFPPIFSYGTGSYGAPILMVMTEQTPGATIHYTLDGTKPTNKSPVFSGGFTISKDTVVTAIGMKSGNNSEVSRAVITILTPQTIDFSQPRTPLTYGTGPISLDARSSAGLGVFFGVLSGSATVDNATLKIWGAGTIVVAADQGGNKSYDPAPEVTRTIIVKQAMLRVVANSFKIKQGEAIPKLSYMMEGLVNGDTKTTSTTGKPQLTTTAKSGSPPGRYPIRITAGTLAAENYALTFVAGTLTITK